MIYTIEQISSIWYLSCGMFYCPNQPLTFYPQIALYHPWKLHSNQRELKHTENFHALLITKDTGSKRVAASDGRQSLQKEWGHLLTLDTLLSG